MIKQILPFHINGITNYIARILYNKYNVDYVNFYEKLYEFVKSDQWFNNEIQRITEHYDNWAKYGRIEHEQYREWKYTVGI